MHAFTEQGNIHRVAMLKYAGLFIVFCGLPFDAVGVGIVYKVNKTHYKLFAWGRLKRAVL
jgi:hypothetical protein